MTATLPTGVLDRSRQAIGDRALRLRADPWTAVVLGGALVAAVVVRLVNLNAVGLNSDEAVYAGQAAAIDADPRLAPFFPTFRAHPLLFQALLSLPYRLGTSDYVGRLLSAAIGIATIVVTYKLGRRLYGPRVGAVAAAVLALMPYHVVVSRQILLDGPMALASTAALTCLAWFDRTRQPRWILMASAALGLAVLTKETSIVLVVSAYVYLGLIGAQRRAWAAAGAGLVVILGLAALHPLVLYVAGHPSTGASYLAWQLFRPSNHTAWFYVRTVPPAMGLLVVAAAAAALVHRSGRSSREVLLASWIAVPTVFFTVWPVKGFQYLVPVAPAVAVLAAAALLRLPLPRVPLLWDSRVRLGLAGLIAVSLLVPTVLRISAPSATSLAGSGGLPGGRETGRWVAANVPDGARLVTIGPSMTNVIEFYGNRESRALSVSTNPLHRNPVYEPIVNPDLALRSFDYQYVVWDAFSAKRSPHFAKVTLALVAKYHGRVVHVETLHGSGGSGGGTPIVVVYQVHP
ncbi:MAG: ArnT family glycosyltransferase [Frankiaceae bacterium]